MFASLCEKTEGVCLVSRDGNHSPPYVGIVGSLHGNERCGLEVITALRDPAHSLRRRLRSGTVVLIHGNPDATAQGTRYTQGGTDLNRLFDYSFLEAVPPDAWCSEHHRARALKPVLEGLDAVLDLHSTTAPTEPFVICSQDRIDLASQLACPFVTYGWDGPGLLMDRVLLGPFQRRNRPAFSVECGQHQAPETFQMAWQVTERFLSLVGMLEDDVPLRDGFCSALQVVHRVGKPTVNFGFSRPFVGFDRVVTGETLGEGDGVQVLVKEDFRVLLPNPNVRVGEDMLYLAKCPS